MIKTKRNENKNKTQDTIILLPDVCSLGVIKSMSDNDHELERLSMIELTLQEYLENKLDLVVHAIRMANSVQLTHVPELARAKEGEEQNSLAVSFHHEKKWKNDRENPLVAAVMPVKRIMDSDELTAFNDQVVQTESLGLTMNFADTVSIVMLLDLLAIGTSPFEKASEAIGNYYFKIVYYGEFQPALPNAIDPLMHALEHRRKTQSSAVNGDSIDLTGLLPDAFA
ncbi:MAG: hypothetical protein WBM02_06110 [bacterium]